MNLISVISFTLGAVVFYLFTAHVIPFCKNLGKLFAASSRRPDSWYYVPFDFLLPKIRAAVDAQYLCKRVIMDVQNFKQLSIVFNDIGTVDVYSPVYDVGEFLRQLADSGVRLPGDERIGADEFTPERVDEVVDCFYRHLADEAVIRAVRDYRQDAQKILVNLKAFEVELREQLKAAFLRIMQQYKAISDNDSAECGEYGYEVG